MLDKTVRQGLRSLSKDNAEQVARHLVMAGILIGEDPKTANQHAQAAVRRAGRIDVVREAAGLTAYYAEDFDTARRELATYRRLSNSVEHLVIEADCERGLGRPEKAIELAQSDLAERLDIVDRVEMAIVASGARIDMGQPEAALIALKGLVGPKGDRVLAARVALARDAVLRELGREEEGAALLAKFTPEELEEAEFPVSELDDPEPDAVLVTDTSLTWAERQELEEELAAEEAAAEQAETDDDDADEVDDDESDVEDEPAEVEPAEVEPVDVEQIEETEEEE